MAEWHQLRAHQGPGWQGWSAQAGTAVDDKDTLNALLRTLDVPVRDSLGGGVVGRKLNYEPEILWVWRCEREGVDSPAGHSLVSRYLLL